MNTTIYEHNNHERLNTVKKSCLPGNVVSEQTDVEGGTAALVTVLKDAVFLTGGQGLAETGQLCP